ncbi:NTP transferase domain-containing protein [Candidatus Peregrinibacteria bacterium]|nr:NTP transferase domain-containing protein [Candidatus Peregrinibacteria bacterium]
MKAVILAGGKSERMRPIQEKPLIKICGKEIIVHQIELIAAAGISEFVIIGSENNIERLKEATSKTDLNIKIDYRIQTIQEGSAGAMKAAEDLIRESSVLFVGATDIIDTSAYLEILNQAESFDCVTLAKKVGHYYPGGYLQFDQDGILKKIIEKPGAGNEPSMLMNVFLHFHRDGNKLMDEIYAVEEVEIDLYFTALHKMIEDGLIVKTVEYDKRLQPIKYPWHLFDEALVLFEKEANKKANLIKKNFSKNSEIIGNVILEDNVLIEDNTKIIGPSYIGKGTVIKSGCVIEESFIGDNCTIDNKTEIKNSFLDDNVEVKSKVVNSILMKNSRVEENVEIMMENNDCANIEVWIRDQKIDSGLKKMGVICGENVILEKEVKSCPGVKIFPNKQVVAKSLVNQDLI